jgi:hypothetical protein
MTRYTSPAQASQDHHLDWHRILHRFARLAAASGLTSRRREPAHPDLEGQVIVFGPCCGDDVRPASARSRPPARRRGRHLARDTEMEAGR